MTDRPILFSAPMVNALLGGRKTQTRRLAWSYREAVGADDTEGLIRRPSPWRKVQPGDRLWMRETWNLFALSRDGENSWPVAKVPPTDPRQDDEAERGHMVVDYATAGLPGSDAGQGPWRSARYMPRWASRLTLTVTDVRAQRLQEITEADAMAEGVAPLIWVGRTLATPHRCNFRLLWNELHGAGAWDANPEVVALTFTVERRNIDA